MILVFGTYTYYRLYDWLYGDLLSNLTQRVEHLRRDVLPDISGYSNGEIYRKIQDVYSPEENDRFIRISKRDGEILYVSGAPSDHSFSSGDIPLPRDYSGVISERMEKLRKSANFMLVGVDADIAGTHYVFEMGASTLPIRTAMNKLLEIFFIGAPFLFSITVLGGVAIVRHALMPIKSISDTAQKISFGGQRQRLPIVQTGDAIEHLSQTLNQMLERLDQAYEQASRFSADASHELRTPLAIIRSELEGLLRESDLPQVITTRIGGSLEEAERLSHIVEGLFAMVRLDAGEAKTKQEVFDFADLVRTTLEQMRLLGEEKNIAIGLEAPRPAFVTGDTVRLKQAVVNLLDNSIKYTRPGGEIVLTITTSHAGVKLQVRDNGIGIPPAELPHIFERFYRASTARSSDIEGTGLGLSIVRSICQAHGGQVSVESAEAQGTTVEVDLPLSSQTNPRTSAAT
ncbi:sensor histidine kinase [Labrys monachus]|uniref:histidine kinase n=1 Tax=Labrys monachus TaxID=217067 RepID=A0ABU0FDM3_9HYPH|nr:HAMP domain-containing sensor histidine kinase [Labrys monachus]MDQ0392709.1 heavy metal sensor kinase [Labrys monachus]